MNKELKPVNSNRCNGCELCALESQRQLKKIGLEGALIRIFRSKKELSQTLDFNVSVDPKVQQLNIEKIKSICPRRVFEIEVEREDK